MFNHETCEKKWVRKIRTAVQCEKKGSMNKEITELCARYIEYIHAVVVRVGNSEICLPGWS